MWFGTTPDENLVDPSFPRRFVPRAFDAIMRNSAHELLLDAPGGRSRSQRNSGDELSVEVSEAKAPASPLARPVDVDEECGPVYGRQGMRTLMASSGQMTNAKKTEVSSAAPCVRQGTRSTVQERG